MQTRRALLHYFLSRCSLWFIRCKTERNPGGVSSSDLPHGELWQGGQARLQRLASRGGEGWNNSDSNIWHGEFTRTIIMWSKLLKSHLFIPGSKWRKRNFLLNFCNQLESRNKIINFDFNKIKFNTRILKFYVLNI